MPPLGLRISLGRLCSVVFLLSFTWSLVEPSSEGSWSPEGVWLPENGWERSEAPKQASLARFTRCFEDKLPESEDIHKPEPMLVSTQYCLKRLNRRETKIVEYIYNITFIFIEDSLEVSGLHRSEESLLSDEIIENCHEPRDSKNPLKDVLDYLCHHQNGADGNGPTCTTSLSNGLKKLASLISTEEGKRSLPLCNSFDDYVAADSIFENVIISDDTRPETNVPKLEGLRNHRNSNFTIQSLVMDVDGESVVLFKRVLGHRVMKNWFHEKDCPRDQSFGQLEAYLWSFPFLRLSAQATRTEGASTAAPGFTLEQWLVDFFYTPTPDGEPSKAGVATEGQSSPLVASFNSEGCENRKYVVNFNRELPDNSWKFTLDFGKLDDEKPLIEDGRANSLDDIFEAIEEFGEFEELGRTDEKLKDRRPYGCQISEEQFEHMVGQFGVDPDSTVKAVRRETFSSPSYSSNSNWTLLKLPTDPYVSVIEQVANSSALPVYDYILRQLNVVANGERGWERVVAVGGRSSMSVEAETRRSVLDYYSKTFSFYKLQAPLLVHLNFMNRKSFVVSFENPLTAWFMTWHLNLDRRDNSQLFATLKVEEGSQFQALQGPAKPLLNVTVYSGSKSPAYTVKWQQFVGKTHLLQLVQQGKELVNTIFGRSGEGVEDGLLDLFQNILTGTTKKEGKQEELFTDNFKNIAKLVWSKLVSPDSETKALEESLLDLGRSVWDILLLMSVVSEEDSEVTQEDAPDDSLAGGTFYVHSDHLSDLRDWAEGPRCKQQQQQQQQR